WRRSFLHGSWEVASVTSCESRHWQRAWLSEVTRSTSQHAISLASTGVRAARAYDALLHRIVSPQRRWKSKRHILSPPSSGTSDSATIVGLLRWRRPGRASINLLSRTLSSSNTARPHYSRHEVFRHGGSSSARASAFRRMCRLGLIFGRGHRAIQLPLVPRK